MKTRARDHFRLNSLRRGVVAGLVALSLIAGLTVVTAPSARAEERVLTLITAFPFDGKAGDKMYTVKRMIEIFNEKAAGKARIEVVGGPEAVSPFDQLKALQTGQFDMMTSTSFYFSELRDIQFYNFLPFDYKIARTGRTTEVLQKVTREIADVVWLQYSSPGVSFFMWTRDEPVSTPEDLQGKKIRTFGDMTKPMAEVFGLVPTNMPSSEVYESLRTGLLDGALRDTLSIQVLNEGEFLKYRTAVSFGDIDADTYISASTWDSLSDEVKQIMNESARLAELEGFGWTLGRYATLEDELAEQYGVEIVPSSPELAAAVEAEILDKVMVDILNESPYKEELVEAFQLKSYFE